MKSAILRLLLPFLNLLVLNASAAPIVAEPPGPSSRQTPFVFSEIMYNPATRIVVNGGVTNKLSTEFLELYNSNPFYEDLSGYRITGDIEFTFPKGAGLAGLSRLVLAKKTNEFLAVYPLSGVPLYQYGITTNLTNTINSLSRAGTIRLVNNAGGIVLEVSYDNQPPWPAGADGTGHSLVLARPSYGENDPTAWSLSDQVDGTPGAAEVYAQDPLRHVVINEILAHTDLPLLDQLELYNHSNQELDLGGCGLSDNATTNKFVFPSGTLIPARGFLVMDQTQLGLALSAAGETVYFWNSNRTRLLDCVRFGAQENGVSLGRAPDGAGDWYPLNERTFGTNNSAIRISPVVLNELMYAPLSGDSADEYVELYNRTAAPVDLSGWRLEDGVSYRIPPGTVLAANSFLVIARNQANLLAKYAQLNAANCLGNYSGSLKKSGERVALTMPDSTDGTNTIHIVMDEVTYRGGGQWPGWARGGGSSLERRDARADGRLPSNWGDSDETAKAPWRTIEFTGELAGGMTAADAINLGLLGEGECYVDDVEVIEDGINRVDNPGFNAGLSDWYLRGTYVRSAWTSTNGFGGGPALHLRASGRLDTGANRVWTGLTPALPNGSTVTVRAKARWLRGSPELLLRVQGNYLEAPGRLTVPANLGTPGLPNTCATPNAGPAIYNVSHTPVLPTNNQPVVVTASVRDPDQVLSLQLRYRVDPASSYTVQLMRDDGLSGDAVANDGVFSALIPGQSSNTLVAFVLTATDASAQLVSALFPTNAPANSPGPRECLVRFGEPQRASAFGTYHQWFTQAALDSWLNRPVLSNEGVEGTFVYGNFRAIYNFSARYAGSPYHQGWISPLDDCHYSLAMPRDNRLLGTDNFNKIHAPGDDPFADGFLAREQTAIWVARQLQLPWTYRRFVNMYVNGNLRQAGSLMEDAVVPGDEFLESYFPDDAEGNLHKISGWMELSDAPSGPQNVIGESWATLTPSKDANGNHEVIRYRWNWPPRAAGSTANDFTNLFRLLDAANTPAGSAFVQNLQAEADVEQWLRTWAARHACGDWDFFGSWISQNMYAYRPQQGRWQLFSWDQNTVFGRIGNTVTYAPGMGLFPPPGTNWTSGPNLTKIFNQPAFRRMYWRAFQEICTGPFEATNFNAYVDSRYNAFVADGLPVTSPDATFSLVDPISKEYGTNASFTGSLRTYVSTARTRILNRIAAENATNFTVTGSLSFSSSSNLVTFTGTAPVQIHTITVNGLAYPVTWLSVSNWSLSVPLAIGANALVFQAWDRNGQVLTNFQQTVNVNYTGTLVPPEQAVGFNEIHPNPEQPGAQFVEIFNRTTNAYNLSGWRVNGLDYTFPPGSVLRGRGYLVLARDWYAYANTFGFQNPPTAYFAGQLAGDGETLSLLRPGAVAGEEIVVDRVRYETVSPWPAATNGASLQVMDPAQDHSRVANWNVVLTNQTAVGPWLRASASGIPNPSVGTRSLMIYLQSAGDIYLDDFSLVLGTVPEQGLNLITNPGFETGLTGWTIGTVGNNSASAVSTAEKHSGAQSLHLVASAAGSTLNSSIWQAFNDLTVGATYTLSFWFRQSTNGGPLTVRLNNNSIVITTNPAPTVIPVAKATPGATNSVAATLPAFPPLWLNELVATNVSGALDNFGEREPWAELYQRGSNALSLAGYYLADNYTNLTQWEFPAASSIAASNFFVVWSDAQSQQSTPGAPHTSFRLPPATGQLVLSRLVDGTPQIVDYLNYAGLPDNWSYGDFPDGQPFYRRAMYQATPAAPNTNTAPPLKVFINEWLADNATTLADPADGQFEDWFEIYNPGTNTVDLGGYYLTDNLANKFQFRVPTNGHYTISPGGFLLVWADNETGQNSTNRLDLHVNFALAKGGEAIGIFAADGTLIDAVTFGPQTTDVSQGRFPDGGTNILTLPTCTPRTSNLLPNSPPVWQPVELQFGYPGQLLTVPAPATDPDPQQTLTYSLLDGPATAEVQPTSGLFTWFIPTDTAPGTNAVLRRVLDSGLPPLSADQSFFVVVRSLPPLTTGLSGNQLWLAWPESELGWQLQVQTNALTTGLGTNWFSVPGTTLTNQVPWPLQAQQESVFFRLIRPQ